MFLGENIRLHHSKINMKNPILGSSVEWHQDWAFYPHTNDSVLEVGIPLANITEENGPMLVIPKSHNKSIYNIMIMAIFAVLLNLMTLK